MGIEPAGFHVELEGNCERRRKFQGDSYFFGLGNRVGSGTTYQHESDWRKSKFSKDYNAEFDLGQLRLRCLSGNFR